MSRRSSVVRWCLMLLALVQLSLSEVVDACASGTQEAMVIAVHDEHADAGSTSCARESAERCTEANAPAHCAAMSACASMVPLATVVATLPDTVLERDRPALAIGRRIDPDRRLDDPPPRG